MDTPLLPLLFDTLRALRATMHVGNPAPRVAALAARLEKPQPGDWVVEMSSGLYRYRPEALGRLLVQREEPILSEDGEGRAPATETWWYIEGVDGHLARWHNASFLALPGREALDMDWPLAEREAAREERDAWVTAARLRHGLGAQGDAPWTR